MSWPGQLDVYGADRWVVQVAGRSRSVGFKVKTRLFGVVLRSPLQLRLCPSICSPQAPEEVTDGHMGSGVLPSGQGLGLKTLVGSLGYQESERAWLA